MSIYTFKCPHCETPHRTLGALLSCHPRQMRAAIDALKPTQQSIRFVVGLADTSPTIEAWRSSTPRPNVIHLSELSTDALLGLVGHDHDSIAS